MQEYFHNPPAESSFMSSDEMTNIIVFYSVRFACVLGPLQLDLEPLGANLVAVHGLDGCVGCLVGGERDESCLI